LKISSDRYEALVAFIAPFDKIWCKKMDGHSELLSTTKGCIGDSYQMFLPNRQRPIAVPLCDELIAPSRRI
jgi:hypothetical protein